MAKRMADRYYPTVGQAALEPVDPEYLLHHEEAPRPAVKKRLRPRLVVGPFTCVTVVGLAFLAAALVFVAEQAQIATLSYRLQQLSRELRHAQAVHEHLQMQLVGHMSLGEVERRAKQLGMEAPSGVEVVVLPEPTGSGDRVGGRNGSTRVASEVSHPPHEPRGVIGWLAQLWPFGSAEAYTLPNP